MERHHSLNADAERKIKPIKMSSVTPGWFWFSVFWQVRTPCYIEGSLDGVKLRAIDATCSVCTQALWAIVRLMIANIVGKFAQLLQTIGRQRMSEVEQQGRRAVLVYY